MSSRLVKRGFDTLLAVSMAGPALLALIPLVPLIRFTSPGPAIFRQIRVGQNGRPFTLYKLRTMRVDVGDMPSHHAATDHITTVGRWLRRTKLDELPQLFNVLAGDMSFVGPRPCLPSQIDLLEARRELGVLSLAPGITGWAQVNGVDMSEPYRLARVDSEYEKRASLAFDCKILAMTFTGRGSGDAIK